MRKVSLKDFRKFVKLQTFHVEKELEEDTHFSKNVLIFLNFEKYF